MNGEGGRKQIISDGGTGNEKCVENRQNQILRWQENQNSHSIRAVEVLDEIVEQWEQRRVLRLNCSENGLKLRVIGRSCAHFEDDARLHGVCCSTRKAKRVELHRRVLLVLKDGSHRFCRSSTHATATTPDIRQQTGDKLSIAFVALLLL